MARGTPSQSIVEWSVPRRRAMRVRVPGAHLADQPSRGMHGEAAAPESAKHGGRARHALQ